MSQTSILIVDDNQDLADGLAMVLEDENFQVSLAYNGTDAISKFNMGNFDIVFLDVKLPDMNGIEVFQSIHEKDPGAKVIMMTGFRIEQVLAEVVENGDVEILRKPFEIKHVLDTLNQIRKESIILIADDDPDFSEGMSEFLNDHGMKTILAKNGQEALDGVLSNPVDILVLDLQMPIMCGLDVYLQLKKKGHAVKTIIVTGHEKQEAETIDILKSMSVTGCLFKPFKPDDMLDAIEQIISS
jgi:DNA-binding response OmpR family regulator